PRNHELCFAKCQAVVVCKLSVAWNGGPWGHMPRNDFATNLAALKPRLLVGLEGRRWTVFVVTTDAMFVQDADNHAVEEHGRGEGFMSESCERNTKTQSHQDSKCDSCVHSVG